MGRICYLYLCISNGFLYKWLTHPQVKQTQKMPDYSTSSANLWMDFASTHIGRMHSLCLGMRNSHTAREDEIVLIFLFKYGLCFCVSSRFLLLFGFCSFAPLCVGCFVFCF